LPSVSASVMTCDLVFSEAFEAALVGEGVDAASLAIYLGTVRKALAWRLWA